MSISNKFFINFLIVLLLGSLSFATNIKPIDKQSNIEKDIKNFITVSAVPSATSEILVKIQKISNILEKKRSIIEIHTNLIPFIKSIDNIIKEYDKNHLNSFTIKELTKQQNEWMSLLQELKKWEKVLKNRIEVFDKNSLEFENYSKLWTQTYINANAKLAPEAILNNISDVIGHIEELRDKSKKQYDLIITDLYTINTYNLTLQVKIDANIEMQKEVSSKEISGNDTKINSAKDVKELVDQLNKAMAPMNTNLKFGVDSQDIFFVSVIESETSKMIRRFPAEQAADFLPKMQEVSGMLFDSRG